MHAPADAVLCIQVRVHDSDRLAELRRVRVESEYDLASGVGVDGESTPDSGRRLRFNTISGASHFPSSCPICSAGVTCWQRAPFLAGLPDSEGCHRPTGCLPHHRRSRSCFPVHHRRDRHRRFPVLPLESSPYSVERGGIASADAPMAERAEK